MISLKTFNIVALRSTSPGNHTIFRAGPLKLNIDLSSIDLTDCSLLQMDIRESNADSETALLTKTISNPSGTLFTFTCSTNEMDFEGDTAWLVISASFGDNVDPLYIADLRLVNHNASI